MDKKGFKDFITHKKFHFKWESVKIVLHLTSEGATVPFIASYRKDKTGNLNETQIREILKVRRDYEELTRRKEIIIKQIHDQKLLTEGLKKKIVSCLDLYELEKLHKPYRVQKETKTALARQAGLEPLAQWIWELGQGRVSDQI